MNTLFVDPASGSLTNVFGQQGDTAAAQHILDSNANKASEAVKKEDREAELLRTGNRLYPLQKAKADREKWMKSEGGIRTEEKQNYQKALSDFRSAAKNQGWSDPQIYRFWNLRTMPQSQMERNKAETETNSILPLYVQQAQNTLQWKKVKEGLKNPASAEQKTALQQRMKQLLQQRGRLNAYYKNLPLSDKIRYYTTLGSGVTAGVAAAPLATKFVTPILATEALASGVGQAGQELVDWSNAGDKQIAEALYTGNFDSLSREQKDRLQDYVKEHHIDLNNPTSRTAAAAAIEKRIQSLKGNVDLGARTLTYVAPMKAGLRAGLRAITPQISRYASGALALPAVTSGASVPAVFSKATGKKMLKDFAKQYGFWKGVDHFLDSQQAKSADRTIAELPQDQQELFRTALAQKEDVLPQSSGSAADRIKDSFLLGIPGTMKNWIKERTVGVPREITKQDLALAKLQLGEGASAEQIKARANQYAFAQKVAQKSLYLQKPVVDKAKTELSGIFSKLWTEDQAQRQQVLQQLMQKGSQLPPVAVAAARQALRDSDYRRELFSPLYKTPQELANLVEQMKPVLQDASDKTSPGSKMLRESLQEALTVDAKQRFINGIQTSDNKLDDMLEWQNALNRVQTTLGVNLSGDSQLEEYCNKVAWGQVTKNPLNINKVLALLAYKSGYNNLGTFLKNPMAFYGTLIAAVPLTVMLMKGLFGGGDNKQQLQQQVVQPLPVQYSIANRGLMQ